MKNFTEQELEDLLKQGKDVGFRPFFSTRVMARLERYQTLPIIGTLIVHRLYLKRYIYAGAFCLLLLLGFSFYQEGGLSMDSLLGLGNYTDDEILNYIEPVI